MRKVLFMAGAVAFLTACSSSVASKVAGTYTGTVTNSFDPAQNVTITVTEVTENTVDIAIDPSGSFSDQSVAGATVTDAGNGNITVQKSAAGFSAVFNDGAFTGSYTDNSWFPKQFNTTRQ